ncbi:MAG: fluoride efflux transporter CrcB [Polyangiaceae bacterium]
MGQFFLVCAAGAAGTGCRYAIGLLAARLLGANFPYGTLTVNILGCFLMAFVMHVGLEAQMLSPTTRITLTTGFMGGLTTYSSFNFETTRFVQERAWTSGILYLVLTIAICFASGLVGLVAARRFVAAS